MSHSFLLQDAITRVLKPHQESFWFVAVSGGIDSSVLLAQLNYLVKKKRLSPRGLTVLHFNHGLRGRESDEDEAFVRANAASYNLPILVHSLKWKSGEVKSQNACREKREQIYAAILQENNNAKVLLAHNVDDLAETIFQRLIRGTGLRGLLSMAESEGFKLRPLLAISRSQIQSSAIEEKISWREDSSNSSLAYERNWLRKEIFPLIEKRRPGFALRVAALSKEVRESLGNSRQPLPFAPNGEQIQIFSQKKLSQLSTEELSRAFGLNRNHTTALKAFLKKDSGYYPLPKGLFWLSCEYVLYAADRKKCPEIPFPLDLGETLSQGKSILGAWSIVNDASNGSAVLAAPSQPGLKKLFGKKRVPGFFRPSIPLVEVAGRKIALVPKDFSRPGIWKKGEIEVLYQPSEFSKRLFKD